MAEIVTPLIWEVGAEAYKDRAADGCYPDMGAFTAALLAVAPLIRRAALDEAASYLGRLAAQYETAALTCRVADDAAFLRARAVGYTQDAAAIRALATQEPTDG